MEPKSKSKIVLLLFLVYLGYGIILFCEASRSASILSGEHEPSNSDAESLRQNLDSFPFSVLDSSYFETDDERRTLFTTLAESNIILPGVLYFAHPRAIARARLCNYNPDATQVHRNLDLRKVGINVDKRSTEWDIELELLLKCFQEYTPRQLTTFTVRGGYLLSPQTRLTLLETIQNITWLTHLELSNFEFSDSQQLASMLRKLPGLKSLNLSRSIVMGPPDNRVADAIAQQSNLESLDVSRDPVRHVFFIATPNLAQTVGNLRALRTLYLNNVFLDKPASTAWADTIAKLKNLHELSMVRCHLMYSMDSGVEKLTNVISSLKSLTYLNFRDNYLGSLQTASSWARAIGNLSNLQHLDLSRNYIGSVRVFVNDDRENLRETRGLALWSQSLSQLRKLQYLNLEVNSIQAAGLKHLAPALSKMKDLKHLILNENPIFQPTTFSENTTDLIRNSMRQLDKLETLELSSTHLGRPESLYIFPSSNVLSIRRLYLSSNDFGMTQGSYLPLQTILRRLNPSSLEELDISFNSFTEVDLQLLGSALKNFTNLRVLDIESISAFGISQSFVNGIGSLRNLEHLTLNLNSYSKDAIVAFSAAFRRLTKLQSLILERTGSFLTPSLLRALKHLKNLRVLSLRSNKLSSRHIKQLAASLRKMPFLEQLDLVGCSMTLHRTYILSRSFKTLKNLRYLNLFTERDSIFPVRPSWGTRVRNLAPGRARVRKHCLEAIAQELEHLSELEYLDISGIIQKPGQFPYWAKGISKLKSLRNLKLIDTHLGHGSNSIHLGHILEQLSHLESLSLSSNFISRNGFHHIAQGLKHNHFLETIDFHDNNLDSSNMELLVETLKQLPYLSSLNLNQNTLNDDDLARLIPTFWSLPFLRLLALRQTHLRFHNHQIATAFAQLSQHHPSLRRGQLIA